MKAHWKKNFLGYIAIALVFTMVGFAASATFTAQAENTANNTPVVATSPFTQAVQQVRSSVVGIRNYQTVRYSNGGSYGFYFGSGRDNSQSTTQEVLAITGSGVVIAQELVITNYHVVDGATRLKITYDDTEMDATLVASDENLDIAIIRVSGLTLNPVPLGDSDTLLEGDWAICIGNPLGEQFARTVTVGVISALDRSVDRSTTDKYGLRETASNAMIQVDAAINSGNSGGGMFSVNGELMGIPNMKYTGSVFSGSSVEGIGMCIPINAAKPLIEDVLNGTVGTAETNTNTTTASNDILNGKPRMGISIASINTNSTAVRNNLLPNGVYVRAVEDGSPAAAAGMQADDIIVDVDDTVITSVTQLQELINAKGNGDTVRVKVYRVPGLGSIENVADIPAGEYVDMEITLQVIESDVKQ